MKIIKTMDVQRVKGGTIFMMVMTGTFIASIFFGSLCGVLGVFGIHALKWNGDYIVGWTAVVAGPFIGAFIGVIWGLVAALMTYAGLRFLSLFRPLHIEVVVEENPAP